MLAITSGREYGREYGSEYEREYGRWGGKAQHATMRTWITPVERDRLLVLGHVAPLLLAAKLQGAPLGRKGLREVEVGDVVRGLVLLLVVTRSHS